MPQRADLRAALLVALGYYLGAQLGFALTFYPSSISALWTPNAILLAALLLTPVRTWWVCLLAALPAHVASQLGAGVPWPMLLFWFVSNSAEALIGAAGLRRFARSPLQLDRLGDVALFLVFAGFLGPFLSSFLDAGFVRLNDWGEGTFWQLWSARFYSNTLTTVIVVPVIVGWGRIGLRSLLDAAPARKLEIAAYTAVLLIVSVLVFGGLNAPPQTLTAMLYAPLPLLLWAAVRFGPTGSSTSVLAVALLAVWHSTRGQGPFVADSVAGSLHSLQLLFFMMSVTLMMFAAVIDERRRARDGAHRQRAQLQLALEAVSMTTWDWPIPSGGELSATDAPRRDDGAVPHAAAREAFAPLLESVHPADRPGLEQAILRALDQRSSYEEEFRVLQADGSADWVIGRGKVLLDAWGRPARLIGINADISERKAAEALTTAENRILEMIAAGAPLAETLTQITKLIESEAPDLICSLMLLDADGVHVRMGAAPSLPKAYLEAIDGVKIGPRAGSCGTAMYTGSPVISTDLLVDPLWEDYRELATAHGLRACWSTPLIATTGQVLGAFAVYYRKPRGPTRKEQKLMDFASQLGTIVLERERVEAESEEQRRKLTHLGRVAALGGLSGALAHELAQPLTAILSNTQAARRMLRNERTDLVKIDEILMDIEASDRRAAEIIEHVRVMLNNRQGEPAPLDLNTVAAETLQLARTDLAKREVDVDLELAPLRPVLGDRVQLEQVLLNLIMNACEAMSSVAPTKRQLRITTSSVKDGWIELSILDSGTGIPTELASRMFEPFVTSKPQGLGLGLSISRSIVLSHGGRLWFENNADCGTTFHLLLPVAPEVPRA